MLFNIIKLIHSVHIHSLIYSKHIYRGPKIYSWQPSSNHDSITNTMLIYHFFFMTESECTFQNTVYLTWVSWSAPGRKKCYKPNSHRLMKQKQVWCQSGTADSGLVSEAVISGLHELPFLPAPATGRQAKTCRHTLKEAVAWWVGSGLRPGGRNATITGSYPPPPFR